MISLARGLLDRSDGPARKIAAVPPMDGALKPNHVIDLAPVVSQLASPDNLARNGNALLHSSGSVLYSRNFDGQDGRNIEVERFDAEITALAADGAGGYAVGLDDGSILLRGALAVGPKLQVPPGFAPTALALSEPERLLACSGSRSNRPTQWKRDLMQRNESGSVWEFDLATGRGRCLVDGLAYPYGIALANDKRALLVTESWKHRLLRIENAKGASRPTPDVVLDDLAGYPARVVPSAEGYWLAIFAPRGQLIEFVLREDAYRLRMMQSVDSEYWMAPALTSGRSFLEPLQLGAIRTMGTLKPWAPTRSYGLLVHLDARYQPTGSAHSRADGARHGITSCVQWDDRVLAACKGGDVIVAIDLQAFAQE